MGGPHVSERGVVRFGVFEANLTSGELRRAGVRLALQDQPFRILALLLDRPGEIVTREELRERLWPADTFVDFDHGLNAGVRRLRDALGDSAENPRFIETVPRRGYRFIAPVHPSDGTRTESRVNLSLGPPWPAPATPDVDTSPILGLHRRGLLAGAAILLTASSLGAAWLVFRSAPAAVEASRTLAVLPFKPLVAADRDEALELGVTETLINQLSQLTSLRVRPLSAVRRYDRLDQDPLAAGRALGADVVIEGSFQRTSDVTRYALRLLAVRDGSAIWSDRFEAASADLLALQDTIAERVATALVERLSPDDRRRLVRHGTTSPDAYLAYVRGRYHLWRRTPRDNDRAVEVFERALSLDSGYAQAYAGLAEAYAALSSQLSAEPHDAMPKARENALRALALDESLSEAHTSLAIVQAHYDYDYPAAERGHLRALALDPNGLSDLYWYGHFLRTQGRFDEALAVLDRARELDPLSLEVHRGIAHVHYAARRFDDAIEWSQKLLDLDPNYVGAAVVLRWAYEAKGLYGEAVDAWLKGQLAAGMPPKRIADARAAYARGGWPGYWRYVLKEGYRPDRVPRLSYQAAEIHVKLGEHEEAFRLLRQAYEERSGYLHQLLTHAIWDNLRSDPRFDELLERINLRRG